jgi:hypothetical protein
VTLPDGHGGRNDPVSQHAQAGRDVYVAGRDLTVNQYDQSPPTRHAHPEDLTWVAAIHATADDDSPLGGGIVLDDRRILTSAHVIQDAAGPWVAFPHAEGNDGAGAIAGGCAACRREVRSVVYPDARAPVKDLAILVLAKPIPGGAAPAPLRCPKPPALVSKRWWAFGFPPDDLGLGGSAEGRVSSVLLHGWIRLEKTSSWPVDRGFIGVGLWSPDYEAVVAVVTTADHNGNARAITLHQADLWFKGQNLRSLAERSRATDAGPLALAAWGWCSSMTTQPPSWPPVCRSC